MLRAISKAFIQFHLHEQSFLSLLEKETAVSMQAIVEATDVQAVQRGVHGRRF